MPKWYNAKVTRIVDRTETTKSFFLTIDKNDPFDFVPGQFITLDLPISDKRLDRWRSYSIANAPNGTHEIELVIVRVPHGKATGYLFDQIKVDSELRLKGPSGVFCLPKTLDKDLVFICTGTGVAPFRSMMQHIQNQKIPHKNIHLVFGTRKESNILYPDEWKSISESNPFFHYDIALSREKYKGYQGYVHELYMNSHPHPSDQKLFYLCGWQNMVDQAKGNLLNIGYEPSQIIEELYG